MEAVQQSTSTAAHTLQKTRPNTQRSRISRMAEKGSTVELSSRSATARFTMK